MFELQNLLVGIIVLGAVFYLLRQVKKHFSSKSQACEGCAVGKSAQNTIK